MKQGIDYFPFYLDLIEDRKFRKLRSQYGAIAVLVYLSLLTMIFRDKGYYLLYKRETRNDVVWEVLNHLRGKNEPTEQEVTGIIEKLAQNGLFDRALFRSGIVTSVRIQKTFYRITCTRKNLKIDFSIWLLDEAEMRAISGRSAILEQFVKWETQAHSEETQADFGEMQPLFCKTQTVSEQRKEKESKEKQRKAEREACASRALRKPNGTYGHVLLNADELAKLNKQYGKAMVQQAIALTDEYMELTGKRYQNCALAIKRWGVEAVKERQNRDGKTGTVKKSAFHNFTETSFDYDAIQKALRRREGGETHRADDAQTTQENPEEG